MDTDKCIIAVGASAGGVEALTRFVAALPADLNAAVLVVLHVSPDLPSSLPRILERSGPLPCVHAVDGDTLRPGEIKVAPPDRQMAVEDGCIRVWKGSRGDRYRPSINVLFRSAAVARGARPIGVILSGALDDGVAGMDAIARAGGYALVQDPAEARHPYLPLNVLHAVPGAEALPMVALVERLKELTRRKDLGNGGGDAVEMERLKRNADQRTDTREEMLSLGSPSGSTCAVYSGALTTIATANRPRCRFDAGQACTAHGLYIEPSEPREPLLWQHLRQMSESADTSRSLLEQARLRMTRTALSILKTAWAAPGAASSACIR